MSANMKSFLRWFAMFGAAAASRTAAPDQGKHLVVSDSSIRLVEGKKTTSIEIADLERIAIRTNDRGPIEDDQFWVFVTPKATLEFPSGIPGEKDLWPFFKRMPGFDHEQIIKASTSTDNATFVCWVKKK